MGRLTTHVLDTTRGCPGSGITISLFRVVNDQRLKLHSEVTNDDGRCDQPLLENDEFIAGVYELVFSVGPYFSALELKNIARDKNNGPLFLDDVVIRFGVASSDEHYHVPLLITPYSYSTYRGS